MDPSVIHAKVGCNRLLSQTCLDARGILTAETVEQTDFNDSGNAQKLISESVDLPGTQVSGRPCRPVLREPQRWKRRVDDPHAVVGHALAGLGGQAAPDDGLVRAKSPESVQDVRGRERHDLDRDALPLGAEPRRDLAVVCELCESVPERERESYTVP